MKQIPQIAILIPCYNEEKSIIAVIDEVHSVLPNAEIYVFDNNSTDKSAALVKAKIAEISQGLQISKNAIGGGIYDILSLRASKVGVAKQGEAEVSLVIHKITI